VAPLIHLDEWQDECTTVSEVEQALIGLRLKRGFEGKRNLRTSVLTHIAWVPEEWQQAATETLAGLAERHPSRTLLLFPEASADDALSARAFLECYEAPNSDRHLCNEVAELRLRGPRAEAPASIVLPLLLPDLPVFLRWRGRPDVDSKAFGQLIDVVDRLVVDSSEWPDVPEAYPELANIFEEVRVSDIAWRRTLPWRRALAEAWPDLPDRITGPPAETSLVAGWLRSRAGIEVEVERAEELPVGDQRAPSDLLSEELDVYVRDPVYEAAVRSAGLP
jgi:Glucose-6-phosphate dehydrogenase subunit